MKVCEAYEGELVDLAGGELAAGRRAEVEAHLAGCDGCRAELAAMQATLGQLERTAQRPDDFTLGGFAHRTADRAEQFRDRSWRGAWWSLRGPARYALALSGAALAGALALVALAERPSPSEETVLAEAPGITGESASLAVLAEPALDETFDAASEAYGATATLDLYADVSLDSAFDALDEEELEGLDGALDYAAFVDPT